ncbi:MAG: CRISPR-associated protein Csx15 [Gemmataceae bacterium]|nr:CRISPR-associated protein Csx15 [Gemmataceae bacterium]
MHLISFLGTGNYSETTYRFDTQTCRTRYVALALAQFTRPDKVRILATDEAWQQHGQGLSHALTDAGFAEPERLAIPTGGEPEQLWKMFEAIVDAIASAGESVMLDITHGFRMQPFFAAACIEYVQSVLKNRPSICVVYGEFRKDAPESPIWELTPFLEVLEWSRNLMVFLRTGQAAAVVNSTEALARRLNRQWAESGREGPQPKLMKLARSMERFSNDFCTVRTGSLLVGSNSSVAELLQAIQVTEDEVRQRLPVLAPVLKELRDVVQPLEIGGERFSSRRGQEVLLALARLYESMGRFSEAYAILREGWISLGAPPEADTPNTPEFDFKARDRWDKAWPRRAGYPNQVSEPRNDLLHAGFRDQPLPPKSITEQLSSLLTQWEDEIRKPSNANINKVGGLMIILNFGHTITDRHRQEIEALTGQKVHDVLAIPTQFDHSRSFSDQIIDLLQTIPFDAEAWQSKSILVNPPSFAAITAVLMAELHGRCGYFPPIIRFRPIPNLVPPQFEVAEIINLQEIRDAARKRRG